MIISHTVYECSDGFRTEDRWEAEIHEHKLWKIKFAEDMRKAMHEAESKSLPNSMGNKDAIIELTRDWIKLYPDHGMPYRFIFKFRELYGLDSSDVFSNADVGTVFMTIDGRAVVYKGKDDYGYLCVLERGKYNGGQILYPANGIFSKDPHFYSDHDIIGIWNKEDSKLLHSIIYDAEEQNRKRNEEFNRRIEKDLASGRYSVLDIVGH